MAGLVWLSLFSIVVVSAVWVTGRDESLLGALASCAGFLFFAQFGALVRRYREAQSQGERLVSELQQANRRIIDQADRKRLLAVAEERNRISRDLHDSLGHRLTVAVLQLEGAQKLVTLEPERSEEILEVVSSELRSGLSDLRYVVGALRFDLEDVVGSITSICRQFEAVAHITVNVIIEELPLLPEPVRLAAFRTVQEALTNVHKHSDPGRVVVSVTVDHTALGQTLTVSIEDDGNTKRLDGEPEASASAGGSLGSGLLGLEERCTALGGRFRATSVVPKGFRVVSELPIDCSSEPESEEDG